MTGALNKVRSTVGNLKSNQHVASAMSHAVTATSQGRGFVRTWNSPQGRKTLAGIGRDMVSGNNRYILGGSIAAGAAAGGAADSDHRFQGALMGGVLGGAGAMGYAMHKRGGVKGVRSLYDNNKILAKKQPLQLPAATYGGRNHYANLFPAHRGPAGANSFVIPSYYGR